MWLMWLLIALAVAMIVGPLMMMQPSAGQTKLAKLRTLAVGEGLTVRLEHVPGSRTSAQQAIYTLPLPAGARRQLRTMHWALEKKRQPHDINFYQYWDWRSGQKLNEADIKRLGPSLIQQIAAVPEGVSSLSLDSGALTCGWDEYLRGRTEAQAIGDIKRWLMAVGESIVAVDQRDGAGLTSTDD